MASKHAWVADQALLDAVSRIARLAGVEILKHYHGGTTVWSKSDSSPVTEADEASERIILDALRRQSPEIPIVSEEAAAASPAEIGPRRAGRRFWLVDPLDGTKEFLTGNGEFTVNIALIEDDRPVLGVVHVPTLDVTYAGLVPGRATRQDGDATPRAIVAREQPADGAIVLSSRSHGDAGTLAEFLADETVLGHRTAGSSLKFCLVAEGVADLYPRLGRTMEWDTAAGHAVVAAAGGTVQTMEGAELGYGKPGFENPHFVARGRPRRR